MFGRSNTAFIFVIRHPIAHWVDTKADAFEDIIVAWLKFYNLLLEDLEYLQNFVVYHQEAIFESTETIMSAMKEVSDYPGKIHLGKVSGPENSVEDVFVRRKLIGHEYGGGKTDSAGCTRTLLYFLLLFALHSYVCADRKG
jgi:hypothetical protein